MSVATYLPHGFMSASTGVRSLIVLKSSRESDTPASRATASRCRTTFVEPPVATASAMPFSSALRVRIWRAPTPRFTSSTTSRPQWRATSGFSASVAGTDPLPMGEIPMASKTVAMVFAVN
jgi:hypothetical protein